MLIAAGNASTRYPDAGVSISLTWGMVLGGSVICGIYYSSAGDY
jgi:hypothetical protein